MDDLIKRAEMILLVFLERSAKALDFIRQDRMEDALKLLRLRNAAFSNFRVVVYHAEKACLDLSKCPPLLALYKRQEQVDQELLPLLQAQKERMEALAGRLTEARRKINGYHSGIKEEGTMRHVA